MAECSIRGCKAKVVGWGWCMKHYMRWRKHGDPNVVLVRMDEPREERFWRQVRKTRGCWYWKGHLNRAGYGRFKDFDGRSREAHRVAWELTRGEIPPNLDHLCRRRNCVRPSHLEPVTHQENVLRGESFAAINARKTHCPKGHPYSRENTYVYNNPYSRRCKICRAEKARDYYRRKRAAS